MLYPSSHTLGPQQMWTYVPWCVSDCIQVTVWRQIIETPTWYGLQRNMLQLSEFVPRPNVFAIQGYNATHFLKYQILQNLKGLLQHKYSIRKSWMPFPKWSLLLRLISHGSFDHALLPTFANYWGYWISFLPSCSIVHDIIQLGGLNMRSDLIKLQQSSL